MNNLEALKARIKSGEPIEVRSVDLDRAVVQDGTGERITEARAEEMAAYALQEARRGRPSLSTPGRHSPQVSFRVSREMARRAEVVAARQGKSLSQLGREALEQYLDRAG